jgi:RHS repeat-associated protein
MQDANWSVTGLVNSSGVVVERYAYDPFGAVTVMNASWGTLAGSAYGWVYGHQGLRLDLAGNDNRGRIYDAILGRFRNMDPIRYDAGDVNLYRYMGNATINRLDPSGLADEDNFKDVTKAKFEKLVGENVKPDGLFEVLVGESLEEALDLSLKFRGTYRLTVPRDKEKTTPSVEIYDKLLPDSHEDHKNKTRKNVDPEFYSEKFKGFPIAVEVKMYGPKTGISLASSAYQAAGYIAALGSKAMKPALQAGIVYVTTDGADMSKDLIKKASEYGVEVVFVIAQVEEVNDKMCRFRVKEFTLNGKQIKGKAVHVKIKK